MLARNRVSRSPRLQIEVRNIPEDVQYQEDPSPRDPFKAIRNLYLDLVAYYFCKLEYAVGVISPESPPLHSWQKRLRKKRACFISCRSVPRPTTACIIFSFSDTDASRQSLDGLVRASLVLQDFTYGRSFSTMHKLMSGGRLLLRAVGGLQ